jgi:SAM-dependent methyltransferase
MPKENINSHFFEGAYKEIWKLFIPEGLTIAENNYIPEECGLQPGDKVLDLMCGYGRNTLGLARKGFTITAIDNCKEYIAEINETVAAENLPVTCLEADVLEANYATTFDAAICLGNSFSFFDAADTVRLIANTARHLKPGGKFIIQTMMIKEIVELSFKEDSSGKIGDYTMATHCEWLHDPERIETTYTMQHNDGPEEVRDSIDYIFTYDELCALIQQAGLEVVKVYAIPGRKEYTVGEPRAYFVAQKKHLS